jgi:hypothetical protein
MIHSMASDLTLANRYKDELKLLNPQSKEYKNLKEEGEYRVRALKYTLATQVITSGLVFGAPFAAQILQVISAAANLISDKDDEPLDLEDSIREYAAALVGDTVANGLLYGPPAMAGLNLGPSVGIGTLFPFSPGGRDASAKEMIDSSIIQALGPVVSTVSKITLSAAGVMGDTPDMAKSLYSALTGEPTQNTIVWDSALKNLYGLLPNWAGDIAKSAKMVENEDYTIDGGRSITGSETKNKPNLGSSALKVLGQTPTSEYLAKRSYYGKREREGKADDRRREIYTALFNAAVNKNATAYRSALLAAKAFSEKNPDHPITQQSVRQAMNAKKKLLAESRGRRANNLQ